MTVPENVNLFKNFFFQTGVNGTTTLPAKPVPPPRDHLKVEKDGRIVNRTPAPQLPARITNNNNNNVTVTPSTTVTTVTAVTPSPVAAEPTREQLDSIKKYQVRPSLLPDYYFFSICNDFLLKIMSVVNGSRKFAPKILFTVKTCFFFRK